jgi:hypothetical protein
VTQEISQSRFAVVLPERSRAPRPDSQPARRQDQWARKLGTNILDGTALQTDSNGNIIVGGVFVGPCDFSGGPVASVNNYDAFLAKYSPAGGYLWAVTSGDYTRRDRGQDRDSRLPTGAESPLPKDRSGLSAVAFGLYK